jgi:hypothetical protein
MANVMDGTLIKLTIEGKTCDRTIETQNVCVRQIAELGRTLNDTVIPARRPPDFSWVKCERD